MKPITQRIVALMLADYLAIVGTIVIIAFFYQYLGGNYSMATYFTLWPAGLLFIMINELAKLYHGTMFCPGASLDPAEELRRIFFSVNCVFAALLLYFFLSREVMAYSRFILMISWPLSIIATISLRWTARFLLRKANTGNIPAIIMGAGSTGKHAARMLKRNYFLGITPVTFIDDDTSLHGTEIESIPVSGSLKNTEETAKDFNADYLIICLPLSKAMKKSKQYCRKFKHVLLMPSESQFSSIWVYAYDIGGLLGLELHSNLKLKHFRWMKKITDYSLAILFFLLTLPVMAACALLVKLTSPGPIIYSTNRIGKRGKKFQIHKFRTMHINSDSLLKKHFQDHPDAEKEFKEKFKIKNDPRVTTIGKFLRATSLDELPQLINILNGQMSLIGPRPIVDAEKNYYGEHFKAITSIKPGLTGLWQVSGRSNLNYNERVELDNYYVMNWSIWLDFYILLKTVKEVLFCRGAY